MAIKASILRVDVASVTHHRSKEDSRNCLDQSMILYRITFRAGTQHLSLLWLLCLYEFEQLRGPRVVAEVQLPIPNNLILGIVVFVDEESQVYG